MVERAGGRVVPEPVVAAILVIEPAVWQIGRRGEVAEDDGPVGHLWPDHAVARGGEGLHERVEPVMAEPVP